MLDDTQTQPLSEPVALALCSLIDVVSSEKALPRDKVQAAAKLLDAAQTFHLDFDVTEISRTVARMRNEKAMQAANYEALEPLAKLMMEFSP